MSSKKKNIFQKTMATIIILFSIFIISISFQYNLTDFLYSKKDNSNADGIVSLYAKTQYQKNNSITSKVAIKNGCGKKRLGLIYKRYLLNLGYDVTETTNAIHANGEYHFWHSSTKILFHKKNKNSAIYLSKELGISENEIFEETNENSFHDLTLILGQNYSSLKSYKIAETFNPFLNEK